MSKPVIEARGVGKKYRIGRHRTAHDGLRHVVNDFLTRPFRRNEALGLTEEFWALRDVSFDVHEGEVLGVIGSNGAGKSTLLKIVSRITEPTEGSIHIRGKLASLLEIGSGFHPELTGRENIYLNGAVLGMKRAEIDRKFDEIVDFSGVEKFLDTPIKRYSSGMFVRLAFSVSAHLDTEILIVDEVLAVGDAEFQKKSLHRMESIARSGRTVLYVSHGLTSVKQICTRALLLNSGRCVSDGLPEEVVRTYDPPAPAGDLPATAVVELEPPAHVDVGYGVRIEFFDANGRNTASFRACEHWRARFHFRLVTPARNVVAALCLALADGTPITTWWSAPADLEAGNHAVDYPVNLPLNAGQIQVVVGLSEQSRNFYSRYNLGRILVRESLALGEGSSKAGTGMVVSSENPRIQPLS